MNRKHLTLPIAAIVATISLTGCGTNEGATQSQNANQTQPMGYYSNENHGNGGNVNIYNENDGPLTEIMDHNFGLEGQQTKDHNSRILDMRDEDGNPGNPSKPLAEYDKNWYEKDNRFSHGDANYHGHLDDNSRQPKSSYFTAYEGDLAIKIGDIVGSVENVEDVRSVVYGSNVLVAVDLTDYSKEVETKNRIRKAVQPYLRGRTIQVETDEGTFSRIRNIDNDLRGGGPREHITLDMKNIFR